MVHQGKRVRRLNRDIIIGPIGIMVGGAPAAAIKADDPVQAVEVADHVVEIGFVAR